MDINATLKINVKQLAYKQAYTHSKQSAHYIVLNFSCHNCCYFTFPKRKINKNSDENVR